MYVAYIKYSSLYSSTFHHTRTWDFVLVLEENKNSFRTQPKDFVLFLKIFLVKHQYIFVVRDSCVMWYGLLCDTVFEIVIIESCVQCMSLLVFLT